MEIAEHAARSHTGRVRRGNEDSLVVEPPLFAIADGMGGARAGEVASGIAAQALRDAGSPDSDPEGWLRTAATEANRLVVEQATKDENLTGMGTTLTAAAVVGDQVWFAHVGDSRAYMLRGGELRQLSDDHSLVAELVRAGRITAEQAADHPQRSVITRAVGAAPTVEVDTWSIEACPGDLFLLCSDGLTDLVLPERIRELLAGAPGLTEAVAGLVEAANAAGGDDNVSVIAFRIAGEPAPPPPADRDAATVVAAIPPPPALRVSPAVQAPRQAPRAGAPQPFAFRPPGATQTHRRGPILAAVSVSILAAAAVLVVVAGLRWAHFVGSDPRTGRIAVFEGLPVELVAGRSLYKTVYVSRLAAASLPAADRRVLFDHTVRSREEAISMVEALERSEP